jgi:predicted metal-dependent hydrolase
MARSCLSYHGNFSYLLLVSKKSAKIAALIESCRGQELPAHYLGYFECFNRGLFYEAHDVLEELWLPSRGGRDDAFYKGLIQFAGAFVHLQKHSGRYHRLRPAAALFRLARQNLRKYPPRHQRLDLEKIADIADEWIAWLEGSEFEENPFTGDNAPRISLSDSAGAD